MENKEYNHQQEIKDLPNRIKLVDINLLKENSKNAFSMDKNHTNNNNLNSNRL